MNQKIPRGAAIKQMAFAPAVVNAYFNTKNPLTGEHLKGNINHSACYWCYEDMPLDAFCMGLKKLGLNAVDLVGPSQWHILKENGMDCGMANGAELGLYNGWNHPANHPKLIENYKQILPEMAKYGFKNLICFSGARKGMDDETGLKNCTIGLKKIMAEAEKFKITVSMELLNSKLDHPDYQCDRTTWGVELCKQIGSEYFKLLYDIYHMQIMEGDLIKTINTHHAYISHYHTGGVPGRHELDETQEIFYPAVMRAIKNTGFKGYVAQEFVPTIKPKLDALAKCVLICDV